jgi:hypothetical protein
LGVVGVGGFDAARVSGRRSIGEIAGEAMVLLIPNIEVDGVGCENAIGCVEV